MPSGKTAVIIVSDGEENWGPEAIEAAKSIRSSYANTCFDTISLADDEKGSKTLRDITQLGDCVFVAGADLSSDTSALNGFVKDVFYSAAAAPMDSDGDGVVDDMDRCPGTPMGVKVDERGCPWDSDGDGVYDYLDQCPDTPRGIRVDDRGCPLDSDGDGVYDHEDQCPGTPKGAKVDERGCWVIRDIRFATGKAEITKDSYPELDGIVGVLERNPALVLEIQGHTDNKGSASFNQQLSERRAQSVLEYLVGHGIDRSRLRAAGYGLTRPVASNDTAEGRAKNRRVELKPIR
jgi:OOP family OmpA-OmpF porin